MRIEIGNTLDQVRATIETIDLLLTAGSIAADAPETGQNLATILERVVNYNGFEIVWQVEAVEDRPRQIRACVRKAGLWPSHNKVQTLRMLTGVAVVIPVIG